MLHTHAVRTGSTVGQAGRESEPSWIHLRSGGVSLLLQVPSTGLPVVRHWGADLGPLDGPEAAGSLTALLAAEAMPYAIVPGCGGGEGVGLVGSHDGHGTRPTFTEVQTRLVSRPELSPGLTEEGVDTVVVTADCSTSGLSLDLAIQLTAAGVVRCRAGLTNRTAERYRLDGLTLVLPAGENATHNLELDAQPLRSVPLRDGALTVPSVVGRPSQIVAASPGAGYRRGEVWQAHVAFSGAVTHSVERAGGRTYLGGGERLVPGEVVLARGEAYHSPWVLWTWGDGLDAAAARLHAELRAAEPAPMPVVFDATAPAFAEHDRTAMLRLAEYAAAVGVETFLLDLDWCVRAGLDPFADHEVRGEPGTPDDLAGLLDRIRGFDLDVGLALNLERLDPASSIARDHPEWLLEVERDGTVELVLDLSIRSAVGYLWERLTKLLDRHPVSLVAWSPVIGARRPGSAERRHASTLAAYRLLDALRERYPEMVIVVRGPGRGDGPAGRDRRRHCRLWPTAHGVRVAGSGAAAGAVVAAGVRRARRWLRAGVPGGGRLLRVAGGGARPVSTGAGQPAGDPPLADAPQGVPAVVARRPDGAAGRRRARVHHARRGVGGAGRGLVRAGLAEPVAGPGAARGAGPDDHLSARGCRSPDGRPARGHPGLAGG